MLDSSYTCAANPNTMRDFGPFRNTVYKFDARSEVSSVVSKQSKTESELPNPYDEFTAICRVNDYTKNISDALMSPG